MEIQSNQKRSMVAMAAFAILGACTPEPTGRPTNPFGNNEYTSGGSAGTSEEGDITTGGYGSTGVGTMEAEASAGSGTFNDSGETTGMAMSTGWSDPDGIPLPTDDGMSLTEGGGSSSGGFVCEFPLPSFCDDGMGGFTSEPGCPDAECVNEGMGNKVCWASNCYECVNDLCVEIESEKFNLYLRPKYHPFFFIGKMIGIQWGFRG